MACTRWMSYCVTSVMDTPFLPAEGVRSVHRVPHSLQLCASAAVSQCATCPRCASHPVDVDLREAGGVVVDNDLNSRNIQTTAEEHKVSSTLSVVGWLSFVKKPICKLFAARKGLASSLAGFLPSCYVRRNQNFVDAGLELGEVCKTLFLDEIKRHFQSPRAPVNLTNLL